MFANKLKNGKGIVVGGVGGGRRVAENRVDI